MPPGGPIVTGIDEVLSDFVQRNITIGSILYQLIAPDVVAVTMGTDDELYIRQIYIQSSDQRGSVGKVGDIGGID